MFRESLLERPLPAVVYYDLPRVTLEPSHLEWIASLVPARAARVKDRIQSLWDGYGELVRVELEGGNAPSVIVKHVRPPPRRKGDRGDARKRRSYEVEATWYRRFADRCDEACRVAKRIGDRSTADGWMLVLEDLDAVGFSGRRHYNSGSPADIDACLRWLASFHARFLGVAPDGLWSIGTYWHLDTRPDELAAIDEEDLRRAAPLIDRMLRDCPFQTLVHGDAKLANFCFAPSKEGRVAAVDFQYVGRGCGMKDVAYLIGGSTHEQRHLDGYFRAFRDACNAQRPDVDSAMVELTWRELYPIACADFYRFLAGWSKVHWSRDRPAQRLIRDVLSKLHVE